MLLRRCCGSAPGSARSCRRPAPPNRPTLPPLTYGASRSTTLIPVSKISRVGFSSSNCGGSRWIGQRSSAWTCSSLPSIASPSTLKRRPSVPLPTGTEIGAPGVDDVGAARNAVGRVHRDGPHGVVAEMLLHLGDQVDRRAPVGCRDRDAERVVDLGQLVGEDGVDDDALDLDDLADVRRRDGLGHEAPGLLLQSRGQSTGFGQPWPRRQRPEPYWISGL